MYKATIDIGSNSILLLIASYIDDSFDEVISLARVTALGKNLDKTGKFEDNSMLESLQVLQDYKKEIKKYNIPFENCIVTATEASRVASNAKEFYENVKDKVGFDVLIINAAGEAHYTALGVCKGSTLSSQSQLTIMDIGGASTEFIKVTTNPFNITSTISLPIGSVRATDWIEDGSFNKRLETLLNEWSLVPYKTETLVCVAGSMTALGGMMKGLTSFDAKEVNGSNIGFNEFSLFVDSIGKLNSKDLLKQYPFLGKRSNTIIAGARVAQELGCKLDIKKMEISTLGLRYGTLYEGTVDQRFL